MEEDHDQDAVIGSKNTTVTTTAIRAVDTTNEPTLSTDRRSLRAYSKKHRVYVFREFLLETYQSYLQSNNNNNNNSYSNNNNNNESIVLDIAGGKGDLSWLLIHFDNNNNNNNNNNNTTGSTSKIRSIVIDPRPSGTNNHIQRTVQFLINNPKECQIRSIKNQHTYQPIASLLIQQKQQQQQQQQLLHNNIDFSNLHKPEHIKIHVNHILVTAVQQYIQQFTTKYNAIQYILNIDPKSATTTTSTCSNNDKYLIQWNNYWNENSCSSSSSGSTTTTENNNDMEQNDQYNICNSISVLQIIIQCKLIIGFHPDQATDSCIDLANVLHIPFAIVPCCVYPTEFSHRQFLFFNQYYNNTITIRNDNDNKSNVMEAKSIVKKNSIKNHNNNKSNDLKLVFCQPVTTVVVDNNNDSNNNDNNDNNNNNNINNDEESALLSMIDEQQEQLQHQVKQLAINNATTNNNNERKDCEEENNNNTNTVSTYSYYPVKRYADLLLYLYQKCPPTTTTIHRKILPFEGTITAKNIVLYTLPPPHAQSSSSTPTEN